MPSSWVSSNLLLKVGQHPTIARDVIYVDLATIFSTEHGTLLRSLGGGGGVGELPEDEREMPTLPPNKDPSGQTISKPLLSKRPPNKQQMVRDQYHQYY